MVDIKPSDTEKTTQVVPEPVPSPNPVPTPTPEPEQPPTEEQTHPSSTIPKEPMAKVQMAAQLDVSTDRLDSEGDALLSELSQYEESKKSLLTKETLNRVGFPQGSYTPPGTADLWNDLTSGLAALKTTDKLEDEKADLLFENMFSNQKENDIGRQMRIAEINEQLHGMRSKRSGVQNAAFDVSKVIYDMFSAADTGVKTAAAGGAVGLASFPLTGPGAIPLAGTMAVGGFARSFMSHMAYDGYIKASTSMYEQLGDVVNEQGEKLSQEERRNIALGVGVVNTAIEMFFDLDVIKKSPLGKFFNSNEMVAKLVSQAQYRPQREALKKLGTSLALNGGSEAVSVYVEKVGEAIGQSQVDGEYKAETFWNVINNLGNLQEAAYEGAIGIAGMSPLAISGYRGMVRREADAMVVDRAGEFNRMRMDGVLPLMNDKTVREGVKSQDIPTNIPKDSFKLEDGRTVEISFAPTDAGGGVVNPEIIASVNGEQVGKLSLQQYYKNGRLVEQPPGTPYEITAAGVNVNEELRRQGIATRMYDYADVIVGKTEPSHIQSDEAKAFWEARKSESQSTVDRIAAEDQAILQEKLSRAMLEAKRDLDFKATVDNILEIMKRPEFKEKSFREKTGAIILEAAGIDHLFIDPIKMGQIVVKLDDQTIKARIEEQLGRNLTEVTGAPLKVSMIDFINMAHEAPQIKEAFLRTATSEVTETANEFIKKVKGAVAKFKNKDVKALDVIKDIVETEHTNGSSLPYGTKNYHDFLKLEEIVPMEIWENLTENQRKELNGVVNPAKIEVIRQMNFDRKEIKDELLDVIHHRLVKEQKKINEKEIANDPHREIIDAYMDSKRKNEPLLWRIDPKSLGPRIAKKFLENERLKFLQVFDAKDGISIDDLTEMLGFKNNTETLTVLSTAYSTGELEFMASQSDKLFIDGEVVDVEKRFSDSEHIAKQLSESQAVMRAVAEKQIEFINKKTEGSVEKKVIFTLPKNETIDRLVIEAVENNSLYELGDETQYSKMVKKHQMAAWKHMRAGDYKKAVEAWTSALYANRMAIEVRMARQKALRLVNKLKDLNDEDNKIMFQKAGGDTEAAATELYELFTVPNAEVRKIERYREAQKKKGVYVPPIRAKRNTRQLVDVTQMTGGEVNDLLMLTSNLIAQANTKARLVMKRKGQEEQLRIDQDRATVLQNIATSERPVKLSVIGRGYGKVKTFFDGWNTNQTKAWALAEILEPKGGPITRVLELIKQQYDMAELAKQDLTKKVLNVISEFDTAMGKDAFAKMRSKEIYVEEFASSRLLRNGKLTEMELFMMVGHLGTESNRERLANFGFSADEIQKVAEKYLTKNHVDTMQKFWDIYELFKEPIKQTNKAVHGFSDTKFIPARDFEMFGHIYKGGYLPAIAEQKGTTYYLQTILNNFNDQGQVGDINFKYTGIEDFTNTDRLKSRTKTPHILSLDPEHIIYSYSALTHDIHMRPILDYAGKLFNDGKFLEALNGFFGSETDAAEFVDHFMAMGDNTHAGEKTTKLWVQALRGMNAMYVVANLALRPLTIMAQHYSQLMVPTQLKNKGAYLKEALKEYGTIVGNPFDFKQRVEFFAKHDPQLLKAFDEIHDLNQQAVTMFGKQDYDSTEFGKKYLKRYDAKVLNYISDTRRAMMKKSMASLKYSDIMAQITARSTLYRMGMEGKLIDEGIQPGDEASILAFVRKVTERTITGNDLTNLNAYQRNPATKLFLMTYMSGLNLSYNLLRVNGNKIADNYRKYRANEETSVERKEAKAEMVDGIQNIGFVILSTSILPAVVYGIAQALLGEDDEDTAKQALINMASPFAFANGVAFALGNQWTKNVVPIQKQAEMLVETAQWYFNLLTLQKNDNRKFKSAMLTTGAAMGLPSTQLWNGVLSPDARKNWNKSGRIVVGTVLSQFQNFNGVDELTPEEREIFDYYQRSLEQLNKGNMAPVHELNEAIKNESTIKSGENESPIPANDYVKPAALPEDDRKELTEEERVGIKDWFQNLFGNKPEVELPEDSAPIHQDAPEQEEAQPVDDAFIPSTGSQIVDVRQLENVARVYAKAGLDARSMSREAFKEYTKLKDNYLEVLNDSTISEENKTLRLSALVVALGESFRSRAYDDKQPNKILKPGDQVKGVLTIGYGFTKGVKIGDTMTEEDGAERLMVELESRVKMLDFAQKKHNMNLNINQRVALISTLYNGGWVPDKYKNSTASLKKGFFEPLLANTLESSSQTHIDGLLKRRLLEYLIFNVAPPISKTTNKNNLTAKVNTQDTIVR